MGSYVELPTLVGGVPYDVQDWWGTDEQVIPQKVGATVGRVAATKTGAAIGVARGPVTAAIAPVAGGLIGGIAGGIGSRSLRAAAHIELELVFTFAQE